MHFSHTLIRKIKVTRCKEYARRRGKQENVYNIWDASQRPYSEVVKGRNVSIVQILFYYKIMFKTVTQT